MTLETIGTEGPRRIDPDVGKRIVLLGGLLMELGMTALALWPTVWLVLRYKSAAQAAWHWVILILAAVLVFNYAYLLALLLYRLVIPYPRPGYYPIPAGGKVSPALVVFMLNVLLVKARHEPPWAAMFSSVLSDLPPLGWLFRRYFGPRTTSCRLGDSIVCIDPHFVHAGRHVQFGYGAVILCHHYDNRGMVIAPVTIGDGAVIGAMSLIMAGTSIGEHAVIAMRSMVKPFTRIGPYEYWAGSPAHKVRDLPRPGAPVDSPAGGQPGLD